MAPAVDPAAQGNNSTSGGDNFDGRGVGFDDFEDVGGFSYISGVWYIERAELESLTIAGVWIWDPNSVRNRNIRLVVDDDDVFKWAYADTPNAYNYAPLMTRFMNIYNTGSNEASKEVEAIVPVSGFVKQAGADVFERVIPYDTNGTKYEKLIIDLKGS